MELQVKELNVLEPSKAETIKKTFQPMSEMLESFENNYNQLIKEADKEITPKIIAKAKRLRLDIGKVRIETGKLKDKQKEYIKLEDKAIMGVHNILVWAVKEKEDNLKKIENTFIEQERLRMEKIQSERVEKLSPYDEDANTRTLNTMKEDEFEALLQMKKKQHEEAIEAAKIAEQKRLEELEEQKRIRKENEKLRKEAEAQRLQEEKAAAERLAKEVAARKEREKKEAEARAEQEKLRKEREEQEAARIKAEEEAKRLELERQKAIEREKELKAERNRLQAEKQKKVEDFMKSFKVFLMEDLKATEEDTITIKQLDQVISNFIKSKI